jgi:hypothetical protein
VIRGQPLDYAEEVGAGLLRYVAPNSLRGYGGGPSYRDLVNKPVLFHPAFQREGLRVASKWYPDAKRYERHRWVVQMLRGWESITRVQGPIFVLFALLSIAAPFAARGPARWASILFALVAWTLLVTPVATVEFSARTAVPGFGALSAAAAMGGWQAAAAVRRRRGSPAEPMAQPI